MIFSQKPRTNLFDLYTCNDYQMPEYKYKTAVLTLKHEYFIMHDKEIEICESW